MAVPEAEATTAVTDLVLGAVLVVGIPWLHQVTMRSRARLLWFIALALLAAASFLGAFVHGFALPPGMKRWLWQPMFVLLGLAMAFIAAGAIADWRGYPPARRALPYLVLAALGFYGVTVLAGGAYFIFVAFQAVVVLFAVAVYWRLGVQDHQRGGQLILAGLVLSLVAGVLQAMPGISIRVGWEFNHNGIYHLVQLAGILCILAGLRHTLGAAAEES